MSYEQGPFGPEPDYQVATEAFVILGAHKAISAANGMVGYILKEFGETDETRLKAYELKAFPSLTEEALTTATEPVHAATATARIEQAQSMLASDPDTADTQTSAAVRDRARQHLVNARAVRSLIGASQATVEQQTEPHLSFREVNDSLVQTTLRHESERLESVDAELALQSEVIAGGQLALEAYAFAAMME